jgi:hypothetical protein
MGWYVVVWIFTARTLPPWIHPSYPYPGGKVIIKGEKDQTSAGVVGQLAPSPCRFFPQPEGHVYKYKQMQSIEVRPRRMQNACGVEPAESMFLCIWKKMEKKIILQNLGGAALRLQVIKYMFKYM